MNFVFYHPYCLRTAEQNLSSHNASDCSAVQKSSQKMPITKKNGSINEWQNSSWESSHLLSHLHKHPSLSPIVQVGDLVTFSHQVEASPCPWRCYHLSPFWFVILQLHHLKILVFFEMRTTSLVKQYDTADFQLNLIKCESALLFMWNIRWYRKEHMSLSWLFRNPSSCCSAHPYSSLHNRLQDTKRTWSECSENWQPSWLARKGIHSHRNRGVVYLFFKIYIVFLCSVQPTECCDFLFIFKVAGGYSNINTERSERCCSN